MPNPFEDETRPYLVVVNDEDQHSLWPERIGVPPGWTSAFGPASRSECLAHVESQWQDMRPRSLREQMDGAAARD